MKATETGANGLDDLPLMLITKSARETLSLGQILGEVLRPGDVVALSGELGAGKTCFTQGIARGLGVSEKYEITSPTFTLANEYPGRINLYHLDVYRLAGIGDLRDIGYDEFFLGKGVVVVEWAEKVRNTLPREALWTFIEHLGQNERNIKISGHIDQMERFIRALRKGGF